MSYSYRRQPRDSQRRVMKEIFRTKRRLVWGVPGTGKTKIGVDFSAVMLHYNKVSRVLIIAPKSALGVWEEGFEIDAPHITPQFLIKDSEFSLPDRGVVITNYDYFRPRRSKRVLTRGPRKGRKTSYIDRARLNTLLAWAPQVVIIDEGHRIKKASSRQSKAIAKLGEICEYAIDLTGTPTGNKKRLDLFGHFSFLKPGLFQGGYSDFKAEYALWGGFGGFKFLRMRNEAKLDRLISPYISIIEKRGIEQKIFLPYRIDMPPKAKSLYRQMEEDLLIELEDKTISAAIALVKIGKLQQISGGFILDEKKVAHHIHSAKLEALDEIQEKFIESGITRFMVFAKYLWEVNQICERLSPNWTVYRITGKETAAQRKESENLYNRNGGAAVCQIASGSEALSFHDTDYSIFYSADNSHIHFTQAQYRIDRDEVTKPCFYYLLQCKGTIDTKIYRALKENRDVAEDLKRILEEMRNDHRRRS